MSSSTKEVVDELNISMYTLRYYEKEGLLSPIDRDKNGAREYSNLNLEQLILIRCMRTANMSIAYIRDYIKLCLQGPSSVSKRKDIILYYYKKIFLRNKRRN